MELRQCITQLEGDSQDVESAADSSRMTDAAPPTESCTAQDVN